MKVLWVVNTIFPDLAVEIGLDKPVVGGWMYGLSKALAQKNVTLTIATAKTNVSGYYGKVGSITYYLINGKKPITEYDPTLEVQWRRIVDREKPDLIHIHGTEYAPGLVLIKNHPSIPCVISIQGLTHIIARYYAAGISKWEIFKNITFKDIIKRNSISKAQKHYQVRGKEIEHRYLSLTKNVIGRTQWDHDHVKTINPKLKYHFCNESLRDAFYSSGKWNIKTKVDFSIFLSQAGYPLKGFHKVVEACFLIKNDFPELKIRIAGNDILKNSGGLKEKLRRDGYGKYVQNLVRKFRIQDNIEFLGYLDEKQMIKEYLDCNVFICPSSIENSPNSLGEAQILGVPCIASYVGGIPSMIENGETGLLYRFSEIEQLAKHISRIFIDEKLALKLSKGGINEAEKRHNRAANLEQLQSIYTAILEQ
ncbi:glycosyltransferase family 4 protein [Maribacter algicola]|uniref:Glycosyltransferase family 4 protein n=1 Tax=Meishania litoralis TaxID=3434685 RepID=A0ACC7LN55_9FLAO